MQREMELQQPPVQQEMKSQKGSVIAIDPDRPEVTQLTSCCRGKQPRTNSNAWGSIMFRFDFIRTRRPTKFSRGTTFLRGACGCEVHLRLTVSRRIPTVGRFGTKRENQRLLQPRDIFHCVRPEVSARLLEALRRIRSSTSSAALAPAPGFARRSRLGFSIGASASREENAY